MRCRCSNWFGWSCCGNIAKIFGELYFLLEYRDGGIRLQYSRDEPFSLPQNLTSSGR